MKMVADELRELLVFEDDSCRLAWDEERLGRLTQAVEAGRFDAVLSSWAPLGNDDDYSPLLCRAVETGCAPLVAAMLERGADPNQNVVTGYLEDDSDDIYDLPLALAGHSSRITELLLAAGADANALSRNRTILSRAKSPEVIKLLLEAGADPNVLAPGAYETPLEYLLRVQPDASTRKLLMEYAGRSVGQVES